MRWLIVALLLSACNITVNVGVPVWVAYEPTPTRELWGTLTYTPSPSMTATGTPRASVTPSRTPTATAIVLPSATPTPVSLNCGNDCSILANSQIQTPCKLQSVNGRVLEIPASYRPFFDPQPLFWRTDGIRIPDKDLSKIAPFTTCKGWGVDVNIEYWNGAFGWDVDFDATRNQRYFLKVEYAVYCDFPGTDSNTLSMMAQIFNADGGTTTTLPVQNIPNLKHKETRSGVAIWMVQSTTANPAGVIRVFMSMNYAVCGLGSRVHLNSINLIPVNSSDPAIPF